MSIDTRLSFYDSLLPNAWKAAPCKNKEVYKNNLIVLELFLTLADEIAGWVEQCQYKKFDALVGNFGCQITALEVQQIFLKQESVKQEVARLKEVIPRRKELLQQVLKKALKPGEKDYLNLQLSQIIATNGLDFDVSITISRLIRLRLLGIVNDNQLKNGVEVPWTNYPNLKNFTILSVKQIQQLVDRIQSNESKLAARYMIDQVAGLNGVRASFIQRVLTVDNIKLAKSRSKKIRLLPNMHNTEACLRLFQGVVLVKNKLKRCTGEIIADAKPIKIWLEIASNKILKKEEVSKLETAQPIIVIEGYAKVPKRELKALIRDPGIIPIVNANCAKLQPQYPGYDMIDTFDLSDEALKDIEKYAALDEALNAFETDHIYCASVKEEQV